MTTPPPSSKFPPSTFPSSAHGGNGRAIPSDPEELRRDIAETRERLGDTVEALTRKVDVKAQARERIAAGKESARETRDRVVGVYEKRPAAVFGALAVVAVGVVTWLVVRRRR